ncbi:MAG: S4 domain-containing protein YaaA [Bacilli bacterium]|jgi:ribosome-associated protein|nr:S4 domain-containing protein YaaA [Bacilli bacterium]MDD2681860.1 S4 domain-containing protein YaaA [Bacilli bacterium]MDD3120787.1 S4 domain-containing protein YaaA [Bacilli bacterium]MDD4062982.1 S4 domain-containing protein YaaA [Bacilli bacterium]MDD4481738.1 S4 domain-containing protein YaaA [Bacilli bacterium]
MIEIKIRTEYITLGQMLKYIGVVGSGSEARLFLENEKVYVNDEEEHRRGRKLYPNYIIKIFNNEYKVI